jgi:hypothetical protein
MPSPFPGMDPYLERPSLWPGLHVALMAKMQAMLNPRLLPNYIAQIETRVYVVRDDDPAHQLFVADVNVEKPKRSKRARESGTVLQVAEPIIIPFMFESEVEEARIEIRDRRRNTLATVIEVLSPSNKIRSSEGRESFLAKRREIVASSVHWVEIDLLRDGARSIVPLLPPSEYWIFLSRAKDRRRTRCWPIRLQQKLPAIGIPLAKDDPDAPLDLGGVLNGVYDEAGYEYLVDYTQPPDPPLRPADAKWANQLLKSKGLR